MAHDDVVLRPARGLTFDPRTHTYYFESKPIPSVTDILRPALTWFSVRSEAAAERGDRVHQACEDIDSGFEPELDDESEPYVRAYQRFLGEANVEIVASEFRAFHPAMRYAGTIDRVIQVNGELEILDLKTGVTAPWMGMQLAAYSEALYVQCALATRPKLVVLQLKDNGDYRLHEFTDINGHYDGFVALRRFWGWRQKFEG